MNATTASCGCPVPAVGAPNSSARRAVESRPCDKPRCRSNLPAKFTDAECEAFCLLHEAGCAFMVDHLTRSVYMRVGTPGNEREEEFTDLLAALRCCEPRQETVS
jgi:hypothetical protein